VVEFVDLYPTVIELAGLPLPAGREGRSLTPLLEDPERRWNGAAVTQILRPADDRLPQPVMGRSIRTERWRYTEWDEGREGRELYDHRLDAHEFVNLAEEATPEMEALIRALKARMEGRARGTVPPSPVGPGRL
jgi:uncharacterized sulfatase